MDKVTQQNAAGAEECAAAAEELSAQAEEMAGVVRDLASVVGKSQVRSKNGSHASRLNGPKGLLPAAGAHHAEAELID